MNVLRFRILTATSLICIGAFFVSTSLLWARQKRSDQDICSSKQWEEYASCTKAGFSDAYCAEKAQHAYDNCMQLRGHQTATKGGNYPSPTPPPNVRPVRLPTPAGN